MAQSTDLRVRRTHRLLAEALKKLMAKKSFDKISVTDICEEAMVHRTTFYTHFADKYELLKYCMGELESPFDELEVEEASQEEYKKYYLRAARELLERVEDNSAFYLTLIKKNHEESMLNGVMRELCDKIEKKLIECEEEGIKLPIPAAMLANMYAGGGMSVIIWWLENGMPCTIDELVGFLSTLISQQTEL